METTGTQLIKEKLHCIGFSCYCIEESLKERPIDIQQILKALEVIKKVIHKEKLYGK